AGGVSDIKRTVQELLADSDPRARLFAIDLAMRSPHMFEPKEPVEKLKAASADPHEEVAQKARTSLSVLLARGFREEGLIRDLGITSRIAKSSPVDQKMEADLREVAAPLLAGAMARAAALAQQPQHPCAPMALEAIGRSKDPALAMLLIRASGSAVVS